MIKKQKTAASLSNGIRDGIPIAAGYLAVSFSLGIAAKNAGFTPVQSLIASLLCNASAGEYAGFTAVAASASYIELALLMFIANARYLLMSCAMSQRISEETPFWHRFLLSFYITDEFFGISMSRPGYLNPYYIYGAVLVAAPAWAAGTALGTIAGNLLPVRAVSALSVALYGMFLAIIIPPSRENKVIGIIVAVCFAASLAASLLPVVSELSDGTRIIILTVIIASAAAVIAPVKQETEKTNDT